MKKRLLLVLIGIYCVLAFLSAFFNIPIIFNIIYILLTIRLLINLENIDVIKLLLFIISSIIICLYALNYIIISNYIHIILLFAMLTFLSISMLRKNVSKDYEYILGFKTTTLSMIKLLKRINKEMKSKKNITIFNINPLIINNFYKLDEYVAKFNEELFNIPDGIGVVYASKIKQGNINKSIPGIELFDSLCELANKEKYRICLYGAKPKVADKVKARLESKYSNIQICETIDGYVDEAQALKQIKKSRPDILFVGLGSPKQEKFIIKNQTELRGIKLIMPVGGTFDVYSGNVKRAPKIIRTLHFEWLYRMLIDPKRFKQILILFKFIFLVIFANNWYNRKRIGVNNEKNY